MTTYIILFKGKSIGEQELDQATKTRYENTENISLIKKGGATND